MSMQKTLIRGGTILSMDPEIGELRAGDVLIEDGVIVAVAPHIEADDCEIIDARNMVVMPGLIDGHRHMWYSALRGVGMDATLMDMMTIFWPKIAAHFTPHDLYVSNKASIVEALDNGITTVLDYCHLINTPEHAPEAIRPYLELPIRVVFGVSQPMGYVPPEGEDGWDVARGLLRNAVPDGHPRIRFALAITGPDYGSLEKAINDVKVARELGLPITMHIGGIVHPPAEGVRRLAEAGVLGADMQFVHCCGTSATEFEAIATSDARVVVCPMAELSMGMGSPQTALMRAAGVPITVGADAVSSATGDQFDEARTALLSERSIAAAGMIDRAEPIVDAAQLGMSTYEALQAVTINAARACWSEDRIGSLTPGKLADIILLRGNDLNLAPLNNVIRTVVGNAHGGNVDTVIVGGVIVKRNGQLLINVDQAEVAQELREVTNRLFAVDYSEGLFPPFE